MPQLDFSKIDDLAERYKPEMTRFLRDMIRLPSESCQEKAVVLRIKEEMESVAESIVKLSEQTQSIGEIISAVNDLADQSNLLSVNASIEAAKAGEHGKGFAVVADEVRTLASRTQESTEEIRQMIDILIVDENDDEVGADDIGELIFKGPSVVNSYYENPLNSQSCFNNGWYYSGDLGKRDRQGNIYFVDRKAGLMKVAGQFLYQPANTTHLPSPGDRRSQDRKVHHPVCQDIARLQRI